MIWLRRLGFGRVARPTRPDLSVGARHNQGSEGERLTEGWQIGVFLGRRAFGRRAEVGWGGWGA